MKTCRLLEKVGPNQDLPVGQLPWFLVLGIRVGRLSTGLRVDGWSGLKHESPLGPVLSVATCPDQTSKRCRTADRHVEWVRCVLERLLWSEVPGNQLLGFYLWSSKCWVANLCSRKVLDSENPNPFWMRRGPRSGILAETRCCTAL